MKHQLELFGVSGIPRVTEPTPIDELIVDALRDERRGVHDGDVLIVAQKLVSKAEGSMVDLRTVIPGEQAVSLAERTGKDPRLVQVILDETSEVVRAEKGHLITEHRLGYVSANAGVDRSNVGSEPSYVVLLPRDPDASARQIRRRAQEAFGTDVAVIICDTHGRPFRNGAIGVALGVSGIPAVLSWRGTKDLDGRALESSEEAIADELASAATLIMGQSAEGLPLVVARGCRLSATTGDSRHLLRPKEKDLFR